MDYVIFALLVGMWICTVIGAYAAGWTSGWDKSQSEHKWDRWLLRHHGNRSIKF